MSNNKTVTKILKTSPGMPEQYEGNLDSGERFYVRIRFGRAEIRVGTQEQWDKWELPVACSVVYLNEGYKGNFGEGELQKLFDKAEISVDLSKIVDDFEIRIKNIMNRLEQIHAKNLESEEEEYEEQQVVLLTYDEDLLRGKVSSYKQIELLEEARALGTLSIEKP